MPSSVFFAYTSRPFFDQDVQKLGEMLDMKVDTHLVITLEKRHGFLLRKRRSVFKYMVKVQSTKYCHDWDDILNFKNKVKELS